VMTIALYTVLFFLARGIPQNVQHAWDAPALDPALLEAIALIYVEIAIVTALALFFSSYSSPMLSAIFTLGVYVAGQFNADLRHFNDVVNAPAVAAIARAAYYVLPDFAKFDVKLAVVHGLPVSATYMGSAVLYALVYIAALLFGAAAIFGRRDFK
jgi:Cu-processing system permease protein